MVIERRKPAQNSEFKNIKPTNNMYRVKGGKVEKGTEKG
jgi:hypothetical protein